MRYPYWIDCLYDKIIWNIWYLLWIDSLYYLRRIVCVTGEKLSWCKYWRSKLKRGSRVKYKVYTAYWYAQKTVHLLCFIALSVICWYCVCAIFLINLKNYGFFFWPHLLCYTINNAYTTTHAKITLLWLLVLMDIGQSYLLPQSYKTYNQAFCNRKELYSAVENPVEVL